ncbi:MAG: alpha-L-rhamnosidase C-terminal domain-containing protein [Acidimicrobiales bacterium]
MWSFRDNACDIPTDCPQRERAGWTGDYQLFFPTAAFLFDVAGFSEKWLRDLRADARPDGCLCNFAPDPVRPSRPGTTTRSGRSSRGRRAGAMPSPSSLGAPPGIRRRADPRGLLAGDGRLGRLRRARRRDHAPPRSRRPLGRAGGTRAVRLGRWLALGRVVGAGLHPDEDGAYFAKDKGDVGTAFLHRSALLACRIGRLLGHQAEADRFAQLAERALDAWRTEFIDAEGRLTPDTQANHVRPLAFGLVPPELEARTAGRLVELIRDAGTHLGTGFLATPDLLPVLADHGHLDVAYELLLQDTEPSWLTMIDRGATTVWETWNGVDADGVAHESLNHYSKGAVVHFLHTHTVGIQLVDGEPGYRRFRVEPRPGGGLTRAEAIHDSPYGRIRAAWEIDDGQFSLAVTVPPGTTAEVILPDGTTIAQGPGERDYTCTVG